MPTRKKYPVQLIITFAKPIPDWTPGMFSMPAKCMFIVRNDIPMMIPNPTERPDNPTRVHICTISFTSIDEEEIVDGDGGELDDSVGM